MKKKFASLLLSMTTVAMILGGCGEGAAETTADTTTGTAQTETAKTETPAAETEAKADDAATDKAAQAIADRKAEAEKSGKYEKVVVAFF